MSIHDESPTRHPVYLESPAATALLVLIMGGATPSDVTEVIEGFNMKQARIALDELAKLGDAVADAKRMIKSVLLSVDKGAPPTARA